MYLLFGLPVGGLVSAVITAAASPAAWLVGRALRRSGRIVIHVLAYAALGAALGCAVILLGLLGELHHTYTTPLVWVTPALCALTVVTGWAWTVRRTRHEPRPDQDALFEDSV